MRINIGVIFGGKSTEHEISIISATEMMGYLDENKYNVIPIYIDKNNIWYTGFHFKNILNFRDIALVKRYGKKVALIKKGNGVVLQSLGLIKRNLFAIDLVMPICHGTYMEDGCLQGYLDMIGVPYTGPSVISACIGQDKVYMKQILDYNGIPVSKFIWFNSYEYLNNKSLVLQKIKQLKLPVYVKPASLGSSIGISKVTKEDELNKAIKEAIKLDSKIIVEEAIPNVKEVNISVLGNSIKQEVSEIEEINSCGEFYSFKEKYVENYSKTNQNRKVTKPIISKEMLDDMKALAIKTFVILGAEGVGRIDFLIDDKNKKIFVNEINTIPGSLATYLWIAKKKKQSELLDDLVELAIKRAKMKNEIIYAFEDNLLEKFDILNGNKLTK